MKKTILATLITLLTTTIASACPGGDLIQFIAIKDGQKMVIMNYDKFSGKKIEQNKSLKEFQIYKADGSLACTDSSCDELIQMHEGEDLLLRYTMMSGTKASKVRMIGLQDVKINMNLPRPKGMPPVGGIGEKDKDGNIIYSCSQK